MSTMGNAVGTWRSFMPLRSCSGASTSTASGSCDSHAGSLDAALSKLKELRGDDWEPCGFIRLQEELGLADVVDLHGYVIVKLCNVEKPSLSPQFMRLDWGHDGFAVQVAATDTEFRSYGTDTGSKAARKMVKTAAVIGGLVLGGAAVFAGAQAALAATSAAASLEAVDAGISLAGTGVFFAGSASACAELFSPESLYQKVGKAASMRKIIRAVETKAKEPYDLISWNCNHFANYLVDVLQTQV